MKKRKPSEQERSAAELAEKIEKTYKKFNDSIEVVDWSFQSERTRFRIKLKGNTTESDISDHARDVQSRLKLPLLGVYVDNFTVYIVISDQEVTYSRLPKILEKHSCEKETKGKRLPYIVGYDNMGNPVIIDLAVFPHLLLGGSTNSGKSVGLQALITSIAYTKEPSEVNFVLIDVGAGDLMPFEGIPHLSGPIIQDHDTAYDALIALKEEMERRIKLEHADTDKFKQLPRLVLVIDEFPALLTGLNDQAMSKKLVNTISNLLQRGRHGKIHLVLAAQNPTFRNMKVDIGNITARIAFKCAKKNFSETILGEGGAENLSNQGSLLLKSPQNDRLQWIQGIYIKPKEIQEIVQELRLPIWSCSTEYKFNLTIPTSLPAETESNLHSRLLPLRVAAGPSEQESTLAAVIFWALGKDHISTNMLMREYHLGWNRAKDLIQQLEELGFVDKLNGKQSRYVRPRSINDLPDEMVKFMEYCDYPHDSIICAFQERRTSP